MRFGLFGGGGEEHPFARYRREKAEELRSLSNIHNSYLLRRAFPTEGAQKSREAWKLCILDSLAGSAILTGLFLLFDLIYKVQGIWYVYLLIYMGLAVLFTVLNRERYRAHCNSFKESEAGHEN